MATHPILSFRYRRLALALSACFAALPAHSLPIGAQIGNGNVSFSQGGNTLAITNTSGSIINWQGFSVGTGETVRFIQPSTTSSVLNRVIGPDPSQIHGLLQSNGRVFLINPAGIMIGPGGRIDVAGFVASSLQMKDADFLAGRLVFQNAANAAPITNNGSISTPSGGSVYLVAPVIENRGSINTPNGETLLAAGRTVEIGDTASPGVRIAVTGSDTTVSNLGTIVADSGRIGLVGALIRNAGTLSASSAVAEGGRIFLRASSRLEQTAAGKTEADGTRGGNLSLESGDTTLVDGKISATGYSGNGGRIEILGDKVGLVGQASIDASGASSGGSVLVGGDYQGKNPDIRNASITYFGRDASIKADATDSGNGGKVIVWANDTARAYGSIFARGGPQGGDGGFVETSGKRYLDFDGRVNTSAPRGKTGNLLLDPGDVVIYNSVDQPYGNTYSAPPDIFYSGGQNSWINWNTLISQLGGVGVTSVTVTTDAVAGSGDITFQAGSYTYNSPNTLAFWANRDIKLLGGALENSGTGAIKMIAGWNGLYGASAAATGTSGSLQLNQGARIRTQGIVDIRVKDDINVDATLAGGTVEITGGGAYQTIEAGGTVRVLAGSGGQAMINYNGSGTQTVAAGNIEVTADNSGANNNYWASINSQRHQSIQTTGTLLVKGGGAAAAAGSGNYAEVAANGTQQIAAQQVNVAAGDGSAAANNNYARIIQNSTTGDQTLTFSQIESTLYLTGSNSGYGSSARIESRGSQSIAESGSGTVYLVLTGGSSAATGQSASAGSGGPLLCSTCATQNDATLRSWGNQTLNVSSISLTGGDNGVDSPAQIKAGGLQNITTSGSVTATAGSSGGLFFSGYGTKGLLGNDAGIESDVRQIINIGGDLTLNGLSGTSGIGVAHITAPVQTINVGGNLALNGGNSNSSAIVGGTNLSATAVIGNDNGAQTQLNVTGTTALNAGSGNGGNAFIGTLSGGASLAIASQSFSMQGTSAAKAAVGSLDGANGTLGITTNGAGGITLGNYSELLAGSGSVTLTATGTASDSIYQGGTATRILSSSLTASGNNGLLFNGSDNLADSVSMNSSGGNISYVSNASTVHIAQANAANGSANVTLQTQAAAASERNIALGNIVGNTVTVQSRNAILDDNGGGVANVTGNNISLTSARGGSPAGIAISADVVGSGSNYSVAANVQSGSTYGGIRIQALGPSAFSSVNLSDSASSQGNISYQNSGDLSTNAGYVFSSGTGTISLGSSGNLNLNGGSFASPAGLTFSAGNGLNLNQTLNSNGNIALNAVGALNIAANITSAAGTVQLKGSDISIAGGKQVSAMQTSLAGRTVSVSGNVTGTASLDVKAKDLLVNGGSLQATAQDLTATLAGDLLMTGGNISAGNNVNLKFGSADSTAYLNASAGSPNAIIRSATAAGSSGTIRLDFPARSAGGIVIDGVATNITSAGRSGFYNGGTPAIAGAGLQINYGVIGAFPMLISDLLAAINTTTPSATSGTPSVPGTVDVSPLPPATTFSGPEPVPGTSGGAGNDAEFGGGSATATSPGAPSDDSKNKNKPQRRVCR